MKSAQRSLRLIITVYTDSQETLTLHIQMRLHNAYIRGMSILLETARLMGQTLTTEPPLPPSDILLSL